MKKEDLSFNTYINGGLDWTFSEQQPVESRVCVREREREWMCVWEREGVCVWFWTFKNEEEEEEGGEEIMWKRMQGGQVEVGPTLTCSIYIFIAT